MSGLFNKIKYKLFKLPGILLFTAVVFVFGFSAHLISLIESDVWYISFLKTITYGFLPEMMLKEAKVVGMILAIPILIGLLFFVIHAILCMIYDFMEEHHNLAILIFTIIISAIIDFVKNILLKERFPFLYRSSFISFFTRHGVLIIGFSICVLVLIIKKIIDKKQENKMADFLKRPVSDILK